MEIGALGPDRLHGWSGVRLFRFVLKQASETSLKLMLSFKFHELFNFRNATFFVGFLHLVIDLKDHKHARMRIVPLDTMIQLRFYIARNVSAQQKRPILFVSSIVEPRNQGLGNANAYIIALFCKRYDPPCGKPALLGQRILPEFDYRLYRFFLGDSRNFICRCDHTRSKA